jgi:hypothetical protein
MIGETTAHRTSYIVVEAVSDELAMFEDNEMIARLC